MQGFYEPGKPVVFDEFKAGYLAKKIELPCGKCVGCRMARADSWATRLHHEGQFHEESAFLTLTYSDVWLPDDYSVSVRPLQLFFKRLRKFLGRPGLRYFACGEYGDDNYRPHYHAILFGHSFPDKYPWRKTPSGFVTCRSAALEKLWPFGHCEIGTVTPQSCGYVARYVTKKVYGREAPEHYKRVHPLTGEVVQVAPEFLVMSKNIGKRWFEEFHVDVFPSDFVVVNGIKKPIPRYYQRMAEVRMDQFKAVREAKEKREEKSFADRPDDTPERRAVREEVALRRLEQLKRDHDHDS